MPSITDDERAKYWDIFQSQEPQNGKVGQDKMVELLQNSQLEQSKLARIWDLADIDGDGSMDFDEFTIAMRLVFDLLQGSLQSVPASLPDWMVPSGKRHLVDAKQALSGGPLPTSRRGIDNDDDDDDLRLSSDFSWYISPEDRESYLNIYSADSDRMGMIAFDALRGLYRSLDIPETDISSAWNLVNPRSDERIDKEQTIVFLHILNQRSRGVRVPRSVPASLRATFSKQQPSYDVNGAQAQINKPLSTGGSDRGSDKSSFAEGYLSSLGLGGRTKYSSSGTDFSSTKDTDWEEVRLKRELEDLEKLIEKVELQKKEATEGSKSNSLVRRELQLLLEYKEGLLKKASSGSTSSSQGSDAELRQTQEEIDMIAEQVDALKDHLKSRQAQLQKLQAEIAAV